ncbi:MAG: DUF1801 domain-containing protein [Chitinophagales bacterium]|nr:DUF1801 domain-containing protein [Chitinophagaceae bacterium]MCB9065845.1 DUF1801 domain-containing protein [Chitinophagales bacterium]
MDKVTTVEEYFNNLPEEHHKLLSSVRKTILSVVPDAEEVISYGMPTFKKHGVLVHIGAFKNHCSLFAGGKQAQEDFKEELKGFKTSAGTIQFTVDNPLPATLIKKIVKYKLQQNKEKAKK